jgi:hypothetical protein
MSIELGVVVYVCLMLDEMFELLLKAIDLAEEESLEEFYILR